MLLGCQVRIEPQRRRYREAEQNGLRGLFGDRARWVDTLTPFRWMRCNTTVRGFTGRTEADLGVEQIPWACEARYQLPVQVWREMIASYFPNTRWLRIDSDVLDQLAEYRARHGLTSRDEAMHKLQLAAASEATS